MPATAAPGRFIGHAIAASAVLCSAAFSQSITGIGVGAPGQYLTRVVGVSGNGEFVAGYTGSATGVRAFRWSNSGGFEFFGSANSTTPYAISGDGNTIVGQGDGQTQAAAFRWSPGTQLSSVGSNGTFATAVNANGSVLVGGNNGTYGTATRWVNGSQQSLPGVPFGGSHASAVSTDGSVIGGSYINSTGVRAFRWTEGGGFLDLGTLGGNLSEAKGISGDGTIIVGSATSASGYFAFRWTAESGMQSLGLMAGGSFSSATAISADGQVTVGFGGIGLPDGTTGAFVHHDLIGMVYLQDYLAGIGVDMTGWSQLLRANAVSADGRFVVGNGIFNGQERAFIADIGVIPAPGVALMFGFVGLSRSRRRA
jgi:probable HAF family extracellular repeat protein